MKHLLIIAWADNSGIRETDKLERFDGVNWRYVRERCLEGKALVYSSRMEDESRAIDCLNSMTEYPVRRLFKLPDSDDVLKIARKQIMEIANNEQSSTSPGPVGGRQAEKLQQSGT